MSIHIHIFFCFTVWYKKNTNNDTKNNLKNNFRIVCFTKNQI